MIFVVEQYLRNRRAKIRVWEHDRDVWINADEYGYRSQRDYERKHPYPVFKWKPFLASALPILAVGLVAGTLAVTFISSANDTDGKPKTSEQKKAVKTDYKVGDKAQVVYGAYKDSVGEIVKVKDDGAILKLTNSTLTKEMCNASTSCSSGGGTNNGELLDVSTFKNLVPYKETK